MNLTDRPDAQRDYCADCGVPLTWQTRYQVVMGDTLLFVCPEHYQKRMPDTP